MTGGLPLQRGGGKPEQRPSVALGEALLPQQGKHILRQPQQPQLVGDGALGLSQTVGYLLLGEAVEIHEPGEGGRFLPEVQVPPLEVLHQGQERRGLLIH